MFKTKAAYLLVAAVFTLTSCAKKAVDEIDFGSFKGTTYRNEYFGFTVTLPESWTISDQKAQQQMMQRGMEQVASDKKMLRQLSKASELQVVNLFAVFEHPVGAPVEHNASILSLAERVREMPGVKSGRDYFFHMKKLLQNGQVQVDFPKDYYTVSLGGRDFDVLEAEMRVLGTLTIQRYYVSVQKGYALAFIVSSANNDQFPPLQRILDTIKFN